MGDEPSKFDVPLQTPQVPIWVVDRKFCTTGVTLRVKSKIFSCSGDDYKVTELETGNLWFRMGGTGGKRTFFDRDGHPVLNMQQPGVFGTKFKVYRGNDASEELFQFVPCNSLTKAKAYITIINKENNQQLNFMVKGDPDRDSGCCCIYIGDPKEGGVPIAKIFTPANSPSGQGYALQISPNIDSILCLAICVCLDEASSAYNASFACA